MVWKGKAPTGKLRGNDGAGYVQRLREDPATRSIPVIFLTAQSSDEEKGLEVGAVDFISKPIVPAVLMAKVLAPVMVLLKLMLPAAATPLDVNVVLFNKVSVSL